MKIHVLDLQLRFSRVDERGEESLRQARGTAVGVG